MPDALTDFLERHRRLFVLTGAGCSTESGIPDYRDGRGDWKRKPPVMFQDFMTDPRARARYWARSLVGWPHFHSAQPNDAHRALVILEQRGQLELLATQNVDGLHHVAGSRNVVDLHGRLDLVRCMSCEQRLPRAELQQALQRDNPAWSTLAARLAPDGDADLEAMDFSTFVVPTCPTCGDIVKPDVVFFGESVPADRVHRCRQAALAADAMLVIGSSLMVYSGYRFVQAAVEAGRPVAAINIGITRADALLTLKIEQSCTSALAPLLAAASGKS
jgi:NAD-dependent SIR2 family protein deacetylase